MTAQLALYEESAPVARPAGRHHVTTKPLCAACRAREARYGFRDELDDPQTPRPRTLCFDCFRVEISRREAVAARMARGWNATQVTLPLAKAPLDQTLETLGRRRRKAQIAARHALGGYSA